MATWIRKPQETEGNYYFSGTFLVTAGVNTKIPEDEILQIYQEVLQAVQKHQGLDYLQVFTDERERKLFFIDQLDTSMIASGQYDEEDNHCTLMFSNEY
jgi:uncharacterized protein YjcR